MWPPGKRKMKKRRTRIALLLASLTLVSPPAALAVVLGEITALSAIGSPLRIEINVPDGQLGNAASCLRLATPADAAQGLPAIRGARISATGSGAATRIVISSSKAMLEPVAQLAIENVCAARMRRVYTLLFPYPATSPVLPATRTAAAPTRAPRPATKRTPTQNDRIWLTVAGESLTSLANALHPKDAATRRQFIRETARANPGLFPDSAAQREALPAGTRIVVPDLSRIAPTATSRTPQRPAATGPATRTGPKVAPAAPARQDRLIVEAEEPGPRTALPLSGTASDRPGNASNLERREQDIAAAIDRSIVNQIELLARIKELEQIQARLMEQANRMGTSTSRPVAPETAPASPAESPPSSPRTIPTDFSNWLLAAALVLVALALATVLIIRSRRRTPAPSSTPAANTAVRSEQTLVASAAPETVSPPLMPSSAHVAGVAPLEWDPSPSDFDSRALAPLAAEEEVEEHDSAIELADIMMSFGRVHGAAETLAEFIRGNPKQAVTPWLKLLEVYRAAGLRAEFDGLARQLNRTFNVKAVTWDNFDAARSAPDSLEKMPHLIAALQNQWGTRECQGYLHRLLRDNREGTREGFPLTVIDEILCLSAVLEQLVGPYKPSIDEIAHAASSTVPD